MAEKLCKLRKYGGGSSGGGIISDYYIKMTTNPSSNDVVGGFLQLTPDMISNFTKFKVTLDSGNATPDQYGYEADGNMTAISANTNVNIPSFTTSLYVYFRYTASASKWGTTVMKVHLS